MSPFLPRSPSFSVTHTHTHTHTHTTCPFTQCLCGLWWCGWPQHIERGFAEKLHRPTHTHSHPNIFVSFSSFSHQHYHTHIHQTHVYTLSHTLPHIALPVLGGLFLLQMSWVNVFVWACVCVPVRVYACLCVCGCVCVRGRVCACIGVRCNAISRTGEWEGQSVHLFCLFWVVGWKQTESPVEREALPFFTIPPTWSHLLC